MAEAYELACFTRPGDPVVSRDRAGEEDRDPRSVISKLSRPFRVHEDHDTPCLGSHCFLSWLSAGASMTQVRSRCVCVEIDGAKRWTTSQDTAGRILRAVCITTKPQHPCGQFSAPSFSCPSSPTPYGTLYTCAVFLSTPFPLERQFHWLLTSSIHGRGA